MPDTPATPATATALPPATAELAERPKREARRGHIADKRRELSETVTHFQNVFDLANDGPEKWDAAARVEVAQHFLEILNQLPS